MTKREQIARTRLQSLREEVRSGATEMTGKTYRDASGRVAGRFRGGFSKLFPEVDQSGLTPGQAASAVERGKGKRFSRLLAASRREVEREYGPERKSYAGKPTIAPHRKVTKRCRVCGEWHGKNIHRFHGAGAFHRTHLFSFNPAMKRKKQHCYFDSRTAICRVKGYRLCLSCLRKLCKMRGVKMPARFAKSNPPPRVQRLIIGKGLDGFYVVVKEGRRIIKIVAGPFSNLDAAAEYITAKKNPRTGRRFRTNRRAIRLGRAVELRYKREIGRHRGMYKHRFSTHPSLFYRPGRNEIVVR